MQRVFNVKDIQKDAIAAIYSMEKEVLATKEAALVETWRKLQTSDHFYYMCTKWSNDGDVHAYFSPYQSPYDAYVAFMNALSDLQLRVQQTLKRQRASVEEVVPPSEDSIIEPFYIIWWRRLKQLWQTIIHFMRSLRAST